MGKSKSNKSKTEDTLVLFKKSNTTLFTHSRTCSGVSHLYTNSAILQIKKNLSQAKEYYVYDDKVKRDFSLETDICVLRRYYRSKRSKLSRKSSSRLKYSTIAGTEIRTIEEFEPNASACGDNSSKTSIVMEPNLTNIDITSLMIENLKVLLNNWIKTHVLENKELKQKFDAILDSILVRLETRKPERLSSCTTYVMDKDNNKHRGKRGTKRSTAVTCQYCKQKLRPSVTSGLSQEKTQRKDSYYTVPFPYKHIKIISTLSIPRNFHMQTTDSNVSMKRKQKVKKYNIINTSKNKIHRLFVTTSTFNLLTVSSNSDIKFCVPNKENNESEDNKKEQIIFFPKPVNNSDKTKSTTSFCINNILNKNQVHKDGYLNVTPSLVKSIYAADPANIASSSKYKKNSDNFTMTDENMSYEVAQTILNNCNSKVQFHKAEISGAKRSINILKIIDEKDQSDPMVAIDFINQNVELPTNDVSKCYNKETIKDSQSTKNIQLLKRKLKRQKRKKLRCKYYFSRYTHFKKGNNYLLEKRNILGHLDNILNYFSTYSDHKDIKLEIHMNILPTHKKEPKINVNNKNNQNKTCALKVSHNKFTTFETSLETHKSNKENTYIFSEHHPNIIPLLDGSMSQNKYIFHSEKAMAEAKDVFKNVCNFTDRSTTTNEFAISQEIRELREVVKELVVTAEKLVKDYLKKQNIPKVALMSNNTTINKARQDNNNISSNQQIQSKGIQISNIIGKSQLSGLKLTKSPKKPEVFLNELAKRSTSYHIIESESILKVTDMTSAAIDKAKENKTLQCSIRRSKSLFDMTNSMRKTRLHTFFFSGNFKKNKSKYQNFYQQQLTCSKEKCLQNKTSGQSGKLKCNSSPCFPEPPHEYNSKVIIPIEYDDRDPGCSPEFLNIDKPKFSVRNRKGINFCKGLLYCILLWVPVIIIAYLFYSYVIQDLIKPTTSPSKQINKTTNTLIPIKNSSRLYLKVSDLGF
ncbi:uncharacterized protein LOC113520462 [Galleria mellonella]|uniref:Uncharacterized protein LOC113520462 n=1 Tax=Galleria mellonella TaxID=7137 RepID=A0ABM3M976_GALME|nr:uncharacterized protein LOC113520462 [Galleria mellonella]